MSDAKDQFGQLLGTDTDFIGDHRHRAPDLGIAAGANVHVDRHVIDVKAQAFDRLYPLAQGVDNLHHDFGNFGGLFIGALQLAGHAMGVGDAIAQIMQKVALWCGVVTAAIARAIARNPAPARPRPADRRSGR
jgi:hypothetical protein